MKKIKEVVMYEAEDGKLYKTKAEAEKANLSINAETELEKFIESADVYIDYGFNIVGFLMENRKKLVEILNY